MTIPALAPTNPELRDLRILVVGLGRSGLAAMRLARRHGARVRVTDARGETELGDAVAQARAVGAEVRAGGHPPALLEDTDLVVLSPGVPPEIELLREARRREIPVWGEVELGARFCRGRIVAITGSNGKSTTTSMLGTILRGAGVPGGTGGNLDTPLCDLLELDAPGAVHALELSSFQLETAVELHPGVAAILNLSPDHLDRYPSYEQYAAAKARILELQRPGDAAILNADDPESLRFERAVRGQLYRFSTQREVERGAFVRGGELVLQVDSGPRALMAAADLPVPGEHNQANALAAALAAALVGCSGDAIARGLGAFRPLRHRLELVAEVGGVRYFNDSKATNPASAAQAMRAFPAGSLQLILGGKDKGADWGPVFDIVSKQARRVLLVGQAAGLLARGLAGRVPAENCGTVRRAVEIGRAGARAGDVVLLAPGCASFDQYRNFEERGDDFRRAVLELAAAEQDDA